MSHSARLREEEEVTVLNDVKRRVADTGGDNPRVDKRDDRVVIAVHDEGGLA